MKYYITGPESSGTRMVARLIADNLNIVNADRWDGHDRVSNSDNEVIHRSMPHGARPDQIWPHPANYGTTLQLSVIICIRDPNIAKISAASRHCNGDDQQAKKNIEKASGCISELINGPYRHYLFHYEAALLLKQDYIDYWIKHLLNRKNKSKLEIFNGNQQYVN